MEKSFRIGDIAKILGISASKIRYWESVGLLDCARESENQYRTYTAADLMRISDLIFYRGLGLSVKNIAEIDSLEIDDHHALCMAQETTLENEKKLLEQRLERLRRYMCTLETIQGLNKRSFMIAPIDTTCIVPFELADIRVLKQYMDNPHLYSRVQHSSDITQEQRGLTIPSADMKHYPEILWNDRGGTYVVGLMREKVCHGYPNDLPHLLKAVQAKYRTGTIISRFLTRMRENGILYDFYKTYIEIF